MRLTHSTIITDDILRLSDFYKKVLKIEPQFYDEDYAEFKMDGAILAIFSLESHNKLAPGSAEAGVNRSVVLEFNVDDVDMEFERLQQYDITWVKPLTTQTWGNRSINFRDPDGNLINFYTIVK